MSCTHADTCPLFPRLQASLEGWRRVYCDHETDWITCARYEKSLTGATVPITLLPNGHVIQTVEQETAEPAKTKTAVADRPADDPPTTVSRSFWRRWFGGRS